MKKIIFAMGLIASMASFSQDKVCDASINMDGESVNFVLTVSGEGDDMYGTVRGAYGQVQHYDQVEIKGYDLRDGLSADSNLNHLNDGENFVVHALNLEDIMPSGVNLTKASSITVYRFVEEGVNIGMTAFAEVRDEAGQSLGSCMGGFFVAPCK